MRYGKWLACGLLAACLLEACKKSNSPSPGTTGSFFANTEWTGTCHTISQQYDRPCYLRFISDTGVVFYSTFDILMSNTFYAVDSIHGKISGTGKLPDGRLSIDITYYLTGEQVSLMIEGENKLTGGSLASINSFEPHLQRCPAKMASVKGTSWSSKVMTGGGPTAGLYAYPDLQTFSFLDQSQEYRRNGKIITYTPAPGDTPQELLVAYHQAGPRIYFAGFDETRNKLIGYFGVLSPTADTMWVDARDKLYARLPNYLQTINWYGPPGITPLIFRQ